MSNQGTLREKNDGNNESTIRRKPLPKENSFAPALPRRLDNLSLSVSTTLDPQAEFVISPTTTSSAISGDEFLGFSPGAAADASAEEDEGGKASKFKTAFEEARHFAGGLVSHPYEATKHYSILRHSHGLVYFRGFSTNIAITVFGDREVPADRHFWLQKKGFSGTTGLKVGALMGTKSAWINVTPAGEATADQLPAADERAWQRDVAKFLRKAPKELRGHVPRETDVLRIPCEAQDGYFRIVLCAGEKGKKVLCPSPVFRLASTSTSSSSLRGASLSTLPVEFGVKIGQFAARTAAMNTIAPVASTVTNSVKQMLPYQPSGLIKTAASTAFDAAGVPKKINQVNNQYHQSRELTAEQLLAQDLSESARGEVIGDDEGPEAPFPLRFASKVIPGSGHSRATLGMPTANLASLPEEIRFRLSGVYMGWASIAPSKNLDIPSDVLSCWHAALITIAPIPNTPSTVLQPKDARVYLIADFGGLSFTAATLSVMIMAPLRPIQPLTSDIESHLLTIAQDIAITQASLSRPGWEAENTLTRIDTAKSGRSLTERFVDVRSAGQKQVDRVPLHRAGIRTESMGVRDRLVGNGGVWVRR